TTAGGGPGGAAAWRRAPPPQAASATTMPLRTTIRVRAATCMVLLASGWGWTLHRMVRRRTARRARANRRTRSRPGPGATLRRSTAPSRARRLRSRRRRGTARAATPRTGPDRGRRRRPARAAPASSSCRSRPASCRACGGAAARPRRRARRAARGRFRRGGGLPRAAGGRERIPRPGGPGVPALERRDVERDRRQIVDQNRPGGERPHRRHRLQVTLARIADLDLARLLARLGREIAQIVVVRLIAVHAAEQWDRPSQATASTAQLALALE